MNDGAGDDRALRVTCQSCGSHNSQGSESCIRCGRGLFALVEGTLLAGRYEILGLLGAGGMGTVYKARDRELDEIVAIKVLRAETAEGVAARRLRSEIKLARKVTHKNVCRIHEYGQVDHIRFIVMEYVEGLNLKQRLQRAAMTPAEAYATSLQIAEGLQAIHDLGIVHRDLKTANIMLDSSGVVRLMDFGLAKEFEKSGSGATATGHIVGTPEYMSPEQAMSEAVDARSDIYALGVVVFELFTGDVPFRGDTPIATLWRHIQEPPPLSGPRAARIPELVIPVLARALAKERTARFGSSREFAAVLQQARSRSGSVPDGSDTRTWSGIAPAAGVEGSSTPAPSSVENAGTTLTSALRVQRSTTRVGRALGTRTTQAATALLAVLLGALAMNRVRPPGAPAQSDRVTVTPQASIPAASPAPMDSPAPVAAESPAPRAGGSPGPNARAAAPQKAAPAVAGSSAGPPRSAPSPAAMAVLTVDPRVEAIPTDTPAPVLSPEPPPVPATEIPGGPPRVVELAEPDVPRPPVAAPNDDAEIRRLVAAYKQALESRDIALFASIKPNLSQAEQTLLKEAFATTRSLKVEVVIRHVRIDGDDARAFVSRRDVVDGRAAKEVQQTLRFSRGTAGWAIVEIAR